jgi:transketolase
MSNELSIKAFKLRNKTLDKFYSMGEAHLGGSFSMIEILIFVFNRLISKKDKFVLSKSHASIPFLILLRDLGFQPKLKTHLELDKKNKIYCTTGSLGHGLPISVGFALANKLKNKKDLVYTLISDGECQEGTTWESLLLANKFKLNNLIILVDYNKIQALTSINEGLPLKNLINKFKAFNIHTINIVDGHSFNEMKKKIKLKNLIKPTVIIFNTIKGKGIKEFENDPIWHAKKIRKKEYEVAKKSLKIL